MKIEALDAGADDYVTKPFSIQELQARVRAQLRRSSATNTETPQIIEAGDFLIDIPQHRVVVRGQETHLTPKQFDLLVYLAQQPGQVLTHRALLHAVWGTNADQPEYLRVTIGQLRKKIELSEEPAYIVTEPWIGYRFRPTGNDDFLVSFCPLAKQIRREPATPLHRFNREIFPIEIFASASMAFYGPLQPCTS